MLNAETIEIETCAVTDFKAGTILYSYGAGSMDADISDEVPVIRVADGNDRYFSPLYEVQPQGNMGTNLNYNTDCDVSLTL